MNKKDKRSKKISLDLEQQKLNPKIHASEAKQLTITFKKPNFVVQKKKHPNSCIPR
jgi:hypothetical protein